MKDTSDQILLSGTVGAGKSRIGCEKGFMLNTKYPGNRGLIVRKAFSDVKASTINQTLLEEVIPESHIVTHNKGEHYIEHLSGTKTKSGDPVLSEIHYHGLDSGRKTSSDDLPRKIGGMQFGWIFVDEGTELSQGEWFQLLGRLRYTGKRKDGAWYRVPTQQIFTATNPEGPTHWMYDLFFREPEDEVEAYRMTLHDNPGVDEAYVRRLENNLSGVYYDRYVKGKWVGSEGLVYDEYNPTEHLLHPDDLPGDWTIHQEVKYDQTGERAFYAEPPSSWRIYRAIDFGYTNPFVCQWWARSPDDTLVLFREIYHSQKRVDEHAKMIKELDLDRRVKKSVADHDAEGRETLNREGVSTVNADKNVGDGILAVKKRLSFDDRGKANLYFMEGARCHKPDPELVSYEGSNDVPLKTVEEISSYVWDEDDDEDKPVKENDHGMDSMRYLVYTLDGGIDISSEEIERLKEIAEGF
jgi:phage terminase large subunit